MFTRSELESKTLKELKDLAARYEVKPVGNPGYKTSWIIPLLAFPMQAIGQFQDQKTGLRNPGWRSTEALGMMLCEIGEPTDEQAALIRATLEGSLLALPERYNQTRLLNLHKTKQLIQEAIETLNK
ncbi:hypothetical protein IQ276_014365 [Desmonostoc muscorum LEGE 12446]|uniref:Uncharacterized protein n=1 Tax=Desmonostoc muscorum LEGE 12446 TaxID=1828758 RepID=A0A8J6ZMM7_DESMC|nr:hypothetical protein [Desmonostoc muscorum]MCF2147580.1 hypothetical protein [Desmonostoc muscorum LEGE 12446]